MNKSKARREKRGKKAAERNLGRAYLKTLREIERYGSSLVDRGARQLCSDIDRELLLDFTLPTVDPRSCT